MRLRACAKEKIREERKRELRVAVLVFCFIGDQKTNTAILSFGLCLLAMGSSGGPMEGVCRGTPGPRRLQVLHPNWEANNQSQSVRCRHTTSSFNTSGRTFWRKDPHERKENLDAHMGK